VRRLLGLNEMKASKLLALLAFAGLCGTAETQARSQRFGIKHLEKERAERLDEHREAKERINELNSQINFGVAGGAESRLSAPTLFMAQCDDDVVENNTAFAHDNSVFEQELPSLNWQVRDPRLIRERALEEMKMREAAREIARIDKAIRK